MRDVNFLDNDRAVERKANNSKLNTILPLTIIILILILGGTYFSLSIFTKQSNGKLCNVNDEMHQYSPVTEVKRNIADYDKELDNMSQVMNAISSKSFINTRLIQEISSVMPNDVFLSNYSVSQAGQISLEGNSKTNESIAYFASKMKNLGTFESVEVKSINNNKTQESEIPDYAFVIDVKIKY